MIPKRLCSIPLAESMEVVQDSADSSRVVLLFNPYVWQEMNDAQEEAVKEMVETATSKMMGYPLTPEMLFVIRSVVIRGLNHLAAMESAPGEFAGKVGRMY